MPSTALSKSKVVKAIRGNIKDWLLSLDAAFSRFIAQNGYTGVALNLRTASIAIQSWVDDLDRYSAYHRNIDPDLYKMAAFLMYWVAKTKPVYLPLGRTLGTKHSDQTYLCAKYDSINEMFAFQLGLNIIGLDIMQVSDETAWDFIYLLYYRSLNPRHLFLTLEELDKHIKFEELYSAVPPYWKGRSGNRQLNTKNWQ
jgi:hypothetical protein